MNVVFEDECGEGLFSLPDRDISEGGLGFAADIPARIGSMLFLSFCLPGYRRPLRVTGEVTRTPHGGDEKMMGVRFVGLSAAAVAKLREYLHTT